MNLPPKLRCLWRWNVTGFVPKTLADLFQKLPIKIISLEVLPDIPITGVAMDSRKLEPGNLFVAVPGATIDGHRFIPNAIKNGAAAVVGSEDLSVDGVPYVRVSDSREALAYLSAAFYGFPASRMTVIGVTGTDGKTTTSNIIYQILLKANLWAGMISTVCAVIGQDVLDTGFHVTTPEAPDIQRYLSRMQAAGLTHVVLEATSHGLAQHRVTACEFDIAVITNVTHEHLDYHGTYDHYLAAKGLLFEHLGNTQQKPSGNPRIGVLNRDDPSYEYLKRVSPGKTYSYSRESRDADYSVKNVVNDAAGLHFTVCGPDFEIPVDSSLVGKFNISNALAAFAATVSGLGIPPQIAAAGIAEFRGVPGRMERIDFGQEFTAIVDFAHTPNALVNALETAQEMTSGRVIAVFGSAGLRDRDKRKMMAEVAIQAADYTILTAEDPRTESLADILDEMSTAARAKGGVLLTNYDCVADRGDAIRRAVNMAQPGDVVIACGKGHEQSMCFGTTEYAWDDRIAMRSALAQRLGISGPKMPYLPTQD
jgi:UDP-N-acetylmuramoyl-L-alanyl-D-glutamate--2,6-diaminopimelate ligase